MPDMAVRTREWLQMVCRKRISFLLFHTKLKSSWNVIMVAYRCCSPGPRMSFLSLMIEQMGPTKRTLTSWFPSIVMPVVEQVDWSHSDILMLPLRFVLFRMCCIPKSWQP